MYKERQTKLVVWCYYLLIQQDNFNLTNHLSTGVSCKASGYWLNANTQDKHFQVNRINVETYVVLVQHLENSVDVIERVNSGGTALLSLEQSKRENSMNDLDRWT